MKLISLVLLCVAVAVAGCGGGKQKPVVVEKERTLQTKDFVLGPEDVLEVTVWRNADLTKTVVVRPDGMISLPLIGDMRASGLTANQLAGDIAKRLSEYKDNPTVAVNVKEINSYSVYVLGEVTKPGKYQLKAFTSVLQAISMAGGFTPFASKNKMQIVRHVRNGTGDLTEKRIPIRYDDLMTGRADPNFSMVMSGDTIVVP